jgi:hypothetical protein
MDLSSTAVPQDAPEREVPAHDVAAFALVDGMLVPNDAARSGWSAETVLGRYLSGMVAWGAEQHGADDPQPGRMTVDMFRPVPMVPLEVVTTVARDGRRLRVVDVAVYVGGTVVCRGSVVFVRRSADVPVRVWTPSPWEVRHPEVIDRLPGRDDHVVPWDQRTVTEPSPDGPHRVWLRETHGFVAGAPISPFVRTALAADHSNGQINLGDLGLGHINADLTLLLAREPVGEWIGLETTSRSAEEGLSVGTVDVYDLQGRIGHVGMVALADGRVLPGG